MRNPIANLGKFAHPPKTNTNFGPRKSQMRNLEPKLTASHKADKGRPGAQPKKG